MTDYRLPENRREYFSKLYKMNLEQKVLPGLVYLYLPALARRYGWGDEQKLWFCFLNGMTQNPITSLVMMRQMPEVPNFVLVNPQNIQVWFDEHWDRLQFDTDRRYQKKDTVLAIMDYSAKVHDRDVRSQKALLSGNYADLWKTANSFASFGRLATFSYLEYVYLSGFGADCDNLMFGDKSGSRSHRNGMLLLHGHDHLVWDKRASNGCTGAYKDLPAMAKEMDAAADRFLEDFRADHPGLHQAGNFTLESNLCTFKNHFYGRRYPGVYADMAWERILWAEEHGWRDQARVFREIREESLPTWLRMESGGRSSSIRERASLFPSAGFPYRGEHFLP